VIGCFTRLTSICNSCQLQNSIHLKGLFYIYFSFLMRARRHASAVHAVVVCLSVSDKSVFY